MRGLPFSTMLATLAMGCSILTSLDELYPADAADAGGSEAAFEAATSTNFTIAVNPARVVLPGGQTASFDVTIQRKGSFTGAVTILVNDLPANASAGTLTITPDKTAGAVRLSATPQITPVGDTVVTVVGESSPTDIATAPLTVHVPGFLALFDKSADWTVPTGVSLLTVKAWGAGGGGNGGATYTSQIGGPGGGGGFVEVDALAVNAGEMLHVDVGVGGAAMGVGGGYSALSRQGKALLEAAGGGGGGGVGYQDPGGSGGAGGGSSGLDGTGATPGRGGTQTAGGAGGNKNPGSANSGGLGDTRGGSGGAGFFGGGGGSWGSMTDGPGSGGGGGSSFPVGPMNLPGSGINPGNGGDPYYVAGLAVGGAGGKMSSPYPTPGGHGRVVLLVP